jgi:hypothetical protein
VSAVSFIFYPSSAKSAKIRENPRRTLLSHVSEKSASQTGIGLHHSAPIFRVLQQISFDFPTFFRPQERNHVSVRDLEKPAG